MAYPRDPPALQSFEGRSNKLHVAFLVQIRCLGNLPKICVGIQTSVTIVQGAETSLSNASSLHSISFMSQRSASRPATVAHFIQQQEVFGLISTVFVLDSVPHSCHKVFSASKALSTRSTIGPGATNYSGVYQCVRTRYLTSVPKICEYTSKRMKFFKEQNLNADYCARVSWYSQQAGQELRCAFTWCSLTPNTITWQKIWAQWKSHVMPVSCSAMTCRPHCTDTGLNIKSTKILQSRPNETIDTEQ